MWAQSNNSEKQRLDSIAMEMEHMPLSKKKIDYAQEVFFSYHTYNPKAMLDSSMKYLNYAKAMNYEKGITTLSLNVGIAHDILGNIDQSSNYYSKSLQNAMEQQDTLGQFNAYMNMGILLAKQEKLDKTLEYFLSAQKIILTTDSKEDLYTITSNIAEVYLILDSFELSETYLHRSLEMGEQLKDTFGLSYTFTVFGSLAKEKGDIDAARKYYKKSIRFSNLLGNVENTAYGHIYLSQLDFDEKKYDSAVRHLKLSEQAGITLNSKFLKREVYQSLAETYEKMGDFQNAVTAHESYCLYTDSIFAKEKVEMAKEIEQSIVVKEREAENALLKAKNDSLSLQKRTITVLAFLVGLVMLMLYRSVVLKRKYAEGLEGNVKLKTAELEVKNQALLKSNRELEGFAYIASHDLKEPLRNMSSFSSLLSKKFGEKLDATGLEYLGYIQNSAKQLNRLVEDVLEFSKLGQRLSREIVDMNELLDEIRQTLPLELATVDKRLEVGDLPVVSANKGQFKLVIKNLIENGWKYNQNSPKRVSLNYLGIQADCHQFVVSDNGIGIKEEHKEVIFEMFNRLHDKRNYEGTGIGLALCKKIIVMHGGSIWLESEIGQGSSFYFNLPVLVEKREATPLVKVKNR